MYGTVQYSELLVNMTFYSGYIVLDGKLNLRVHRKSDQLCSAVEKRRFRWRIF